MLVDGKQKIAHYLVLFVHQRLFISPLLFVSPEIAWKSPIRNYATIFYQILSTNSLGKGMKISLENLYVDKRIKRKGHAILRDYQYLLRYTYLVIWRLKRFLSSFVVQSS